MYTYAVLCKSIYTLLHTCICTGYVMDPFKVLNLPHTFLWDPSFSSAFIYRPPANPGRYRLGLLSDGLDGLCTRAPTSRSPAHTALCPSF